MIDTNQVQQAADTVALAKASLAPYLLALAVGAAWAGREIRNFNLWLFNAAEFVIGHGGLGMILKKLIWNPGMAPVTRENPEPGK